MKDSTFLCAFDCSIDTGNVRSRCYHLSCSNFRLLGVFIVNLLTSDFVALPKSRNYKERNVQSKRRKAIRQWFVSIRQWFVMGAMLLASALTEVFPPGISGSFQIFLGGEFLCLGHWLETWRPCVVPHAQWRTPYAFSYPPVSLCSLYSLALLPACCFPQPCYKMITTTCQQLWIGLKNCNIFVRTITAHKFLPPGFVSTVWGFIRYVESTQKRNQELLIKLHHHSKICQ